ncbi:MAG TPA: acireductone synthase, partial [Thermoanaerobaculia bacterium]|nr:acireductone synthase [Thermoanaerobaculia bacterium]
MRPPTAILTDIEGTTTSIAFVYDVLFPYAAARLDAACARPGADPELQEALARLREEHGREAAGEPPPPFGDGAPYARWLMERDRKSTGLKLLQGWIWAEGYTRGEIRGHVYADVPAALAAWRAAGRRLRIFSSGSVRAQKLLFSHTDYGDLSPHFEGFHDTLTGPKQTPSAYTAIAGAFALPPAEILFLSDVTAELDAAALAGCRTGLLVRPGNRPAAPGVHPVYRRF